MNEQRGWKDAGDRSENGVFSESLANTVNCFKYTLPLQVFKGGLFHDDQGGLSKLDGEQEDVEDD